MRGRNFKAVNIKIGLPIGEVSLDSVPWRTVLAGFCINAPLHGVLPLTISKRLPKKKYPSLRGSTSECTNIVYPSGCGQDETSEQDKVFEELRKKGPRGWLGLQRQLSYVSAK